MSQTFDHVTHLNDVKGQTPTYLAIGSFDGVHLGHQAVLQSLVAAARQDSVRAAVLTFFPHPKRVLGRAEGRYYITTLADRVQLIAAQGVDLVITHPFNAEVRHMRAAKFVAQLRATLDMRQLWGGNFALGYQREGDIPFLRRLGTEMGYTVERVDAMVEYAGRRVSSSRIRHGLRQGMVDDVNGCLGRPYQLSGDVVEGDRRGHIIGFPTANLRVWDELLLPADGVYATYAWVGTQRYVAATNVGMRPTVNGRQRTVEAHLLDFDADLYGQTLRLDFISRIRSEMKFAGLEALKAQIAADVVATRRRLSPKRQ